MKVLVTGGAGMIGMALRRQLPAHGHSVIATDITDFGRRDPDLVRLPLADIDAHEALVEAHDIDAIVHGGGLSGPMMMRDQPTEIVRINVASTAGLLDIARRHHLRRFILLSSHVVYGNTGQDVIGEDRPLQPFTTYAATKIAGEALVESFSRQWGLCAASLRPTRVYGAYRRANCFLRQMLIDAAAGATTTIPCETDYPYHFISVEDVAGAIIACLEAPRLNHHAYNLASEQVLTMPQVRDIARNTIPGADIALVPGVDDAPEIQKAFSLERLRADTGWTPQFPLARGLAHYGAQVAADPGAIG